MPSTFPPPSVPPPPPPPAVLLQHGTGPEAEALRNEAAMAKRLAGPSVLPLLEANDDPESDSVTLVYQAPEGGRLADWSPRSVGHLATVFAAGFESLAELHRAGVVHGALSDHTVLLDGSHRPVFAGLAKAGPANPISLEVDIAALMALLDDAFSRLVPAGNSGPRRGWFGDRDARRLRRLVSDFHATPRSERPSADHIGTVLADMADSPRDVAAPPPAPSQAPIAATTTPAITAEATSETHSALAPTRRFRVRPPRPKLEPTSQPVRLIVVTVAAVTFVAVAGFVWFNYGDSDPTQPATVALVNESTPAPAAPNPVAATDARPAPQPTAEPNNPQPIEPRCAGVLVDDQCLQVELGDGFVVVGRQRFGVGTGQEHLALGDWDCDGVATVAAVNPSSGEVFVFDEWRFDGPIEARLVAVLADVSSPRTVELGNGCHDLEVPNGNEIWTLTGANT